MCGIAGYVAPAGERPSRAILERMCAVIQHRGPDSDGYYLDGPAALGVRRLRIIDLVTGEQPIGDETGQRWIVYNGEIYNFPELRERLQRDGHLLRSRTDTETVVHLYEQYGATCVDALRGMFAFAIWNAAEQKLLLVRDRLGVKPLYYCPLEGGGLVFGSELKSLLQHPRVTRQPDLGAVEALLAYKYVPEPSTGFAGIYKLPAGCLLQWTAGQYEIRRYWDVETVHDGSVRSDDEWTDELLTQLREATRIRLMSDVPLGAFLSGGIDSSMVVALMAESSPAPVRTFSIGFPGSDRSELPYARAVARHLQTEHHEFDVEPQYVEELLPELVWHFDEPFADSSALPTYLLSKLARSAVTVVLTGDGGDEAFAGYNSFRGEAFSQAYARLPRPISRWAIPALSTAATRVAPPRFALAAARAQRVTHDASLDFLERYVRRGLCFSDAERAALLNAHGFPPNGDARAAPAAVDARGRRQNPLERLAFLETRFYLVNDMLTKVDRMSMAHSLEARGPFLDHKLVEWAAGIPMHLKLRRGTTKFLLKRLAMRYLPPEIPYRSKQGFEIPLNAWLRGDLASFARETLLGPESACRRFFAVGALERTLSSFALERGGNRAAEKVWILLTFEFWYRMYFDNAFGRF
jgi:asparagine synthase (glutamine-hydrolysing)